MCFQSSANRGLMLFTPSCEHWPLPLGAPYPNWVPNKVAGGHMHCFKVGAVVCSAMLSCRLGLQAFDALFPLRALTSAAAADWMLSFFGDLPQRRCVPV